MSESRLVMRKESKQNQELRELARLLHAVAYHRGKIDKLWLRLEALRAKMKVPRRKK